MIQQTARNLHGINTQVLLQKYSDRIFVLVTQLGKVGCLIQASLPPTIPLPPPPLTPELPSPPPAIELTPLFGHPPTPHLHTLYNLLASQVATVVWADEERVRGAAGRRTVVVGIALKVTHGEEDQPSDAERDLFTEVVAMVRQCL